MVGVARPADHPPPSGPHLAVTWSTPWAAYLRLNDFADEIFERQRTAEPARPFQAWALSQVPSSWQRERVRGRGRSGSVPANSRTMVESGLSSPVVVEEHAARGQVDDADFLAIFHASRAKAAQLAGRESAMCPFFGV